jgi:hypothetical protein
VLKQNRRQSTILDRKKNKGEKDGHLCEHAATQFRQKNRDGKQNTKQWVAAKIGIKFKPRLFRLYLDRV